MLTCFCVCVCVCVCLWFSQYANAVAWWWLCKWGGSRGGQLSLPPPLSNELWPRGNLHNEVAVMKKWENINKLILTGGEEERGGCKWGESRGPPYPRIKVALIGVVVEDYANEGGWTGESSWILFLFDKQTIFVALCRWTWNCNCIASFNFGCWQPFFGRDRSIHIGWHRHNFWKWVADCRRLCCRVGENLAWKFPSWFPAGSVDGAGETGL